MATARWRKEPFRAFFDTIAKEVTARKKLRESGDHTVTEVVNEEQNKAFDKASSKVILLQVEIDEVCVEEFPTYEHLNQLKYADAVMKEALRLYPIAAFASARTCMETTTLGDYTIEAGTVVQADVLSVHYDKTLWEEPDKFKPERWLENTSNPAVPQWFAFGGGPRLCIGLRLAYLEEKQALVYILRKYNILACDQTEKELKMVGGSVLNPESVTVKLELR
uniref:Cytochrome P450 n=1 Tax=Ditylenchus dipsaci TaxID=166011 RepID=A0A915EBL5_9BILA